MISVNSGLPHRAHSEVHTLPPPKYDEQDELSVQMIATSIIAPKAIRPASALLAEIKEGPVRTPCMQLNEHSSEGKVPIRRYRSIFPAEFPFAKPLTVACEAEKDLYVKFLEKIASKKPRDPDQVEQIIKELNKEITESNKTPSEKQVENELLRVAVDAFQERCELLCGMQKSKVVSPGGIERNFQQIMCDAAQKNLFKYMKSDRSALTEEGIAQGVDDENIAEEVEDEFQEALAEHELQVLKDWQYRGVNKAVPLEDFVRSLLKEERDTALMYAQSSSSNQTEMEALFKELYDEEALFKEYMADRRFIDACDVPEKYRSKTEDEV